MYRYVFLIMKQMDGSYWEHNEDWWDKFDEWRENDRALSFMEGYADWIEEEE